LNLRAALFASVGLYAAFGGAPASAKPVRVDVPRQQAITGVSELARQANIQILVSERVLRGKTTTAVRGTFEPEQAFERLLTNTGLRAVKIDERTFTVVEGATVPAGPAESVTPTPAPAPPIIVVTGFRSSLREALAVKRAATGSTDTIVAEDVGKFPESNLAEAMQRLPGVALSRGDGGEGRNITVRGLGPEFTRVRIDGIEVASQTGASDAYGGSNSGRSFDFNVFPSEIFSSLSIRKTASADVEEGSLGATVDLETTHPLDSRSNFVLTASARGQYNEMAQQLDPKLSGLVSVKNEDGTLGFLASVAYNRRHTRDVGYSAVLVLPAWVNGGFCSPVGVLPLNPAPNPGKGTDALNCSTGNPRTGSLDAWNTVQSREGPSGQPGGGAFFPRLPRYLDSEQQVKRLGATVSFQWAPDDATNVTLDGLYTDYSVVRADSYISGVSFARSDSNNGQPMTSVRDVQIDADGSVVYGLYDGVDVRSERWVSEFSTKIKQGVLSVDRKLAENVKLSGRAGIEISNYDQPARGWFNMDANDADGFSVDFRPNRTYPTIGFGMDVADPRNFEFGPALADGTVLGTLAETDSTRVTRNKSLDLKVEWELAKGFQLLAGSQFRQNRYREQTLRLDPARQSVPALPPGVPLSSLTLEITDLDKLLGHGAPSAWAAIDRDKMRAAIGYDKSWLCGVECGNGPEGVKETTTGAFAMLKLDTRDLLPLRIRGDLGVRYVRTKQYSFGYVPIANPPGSRYPTSGQFSEARRSYADWLPSANLVADLAPDLLLRLAAAKVMARPDLGPLVPNSTIDAVGRRGNLTNPYLQPTRATTYDAAMEWYFAPGSLLSLAYFRKDISTYIQRISSLVPFNQLGLPNELLANSQTQPNELFIINQLTNTPGGTLQGIEINAQMPLHFLPGFLGNFGLMSSYTLARSKIDYILQSANGAPTLTTTADLLGLSRSSASGTVYYEDSGFSARITANYRSRYIRTIPSGAADSDYIANRPTFDVDLQTTYQITPGVKVLFEGLNLTNQSNVQYIDSQRQDSLFALRFGRSFSVGLTFRS